MIYTASLDHHQPPPNWLNDFLQSGFPPQNLDGFHRLDRMERREIRGRAEGRSRSRGGDRAVAGHSNGKKSRSRSRGKHREIGGVHKDEWTFRPTEPDPTFKHVEKKPSQKRLKPILKHGDSRIFFDNTEGPYYGFNTFSDHSVVYGGARFPTAEHLLLCFKASLPLTPFVTMDVD